MLKRLIVILFSGCFALSCGTQGKVTLSDQKPLSALLTTENVEYVVNRPINMGGKTIVFPKGATVVFKRNGSISNGKIVGNETTLKNPKLKNIRYGGTFLNTKVSLSDQFDGETDFWGMVQAFPYAELTLSKDISLPTSSEKSIKAVQFHLDGKGHTVAVHRNPVLQNTDVHIVNTHFDCRDAVNCVIFGLGGDTTKAFVIRNCVFSNVPEISTIFSRAYENVLIEKCQISGLLEDNSRSLEKYIYQIRVHSCTGKVIVRNNTIYNCFGVGIAGQYFNPEDNTNVLIENNVIDNVTGGGIIFVSGAVRNAVVRGNRISRTHSRGIQFEGEINGGPSSAINFHGFYNALVENNVIADCPNSSSFDFDGSLKGENRVVKGTGLIVRGNKVTSSGPVAFFAVENVDVSDNSFEGNIYYKSGAAFFVMGGNNFRMHGNVLTYKQNKGETAYPIYVKDANDIKSGNVKIDANKIIFDGNHYVYVGANFSGECKIDDNAVIHSGNTKGTLDVVNKSKSRVNIRNTRTIIKN